ncbi:MAG: hypothetical protein JST16_07245 [Bdellovibrionales bacterium]|nr:hypothetical protein [Bdellovibrionales bacterium]
MARGALGGTTQPPGPHSGLEEVSPLILDIELVKGDPYIEVFVTGMGHLDCYDVHEFDVQKTPTYTQIVPRLKRSKPERPCKLGLKKYRDKAADLDPQSPASLEVHVLGFRGWHKRILGQPSTPTGEKP